MKLHPRQEALRDRQVQDMRRYHLLLNNINFLRNMRDSHLRTEQIHEMEKRAISILDYWDKLYTRRMQTGLRLVKDARKESVKSFFGWG